MLCQHLPHTQLEFSAVFVVYILTPAVLTCTDFRPSRVTAPDCPIVRRRSCAALAQRNGECAAIQALDTLYSPTTPSTELLCGSQSEVESTLQRISSHKVNKYTKVTAKHNVYVAPACKVYLGYCAGSLGLYCCQQGWSDSENDL